MIIENRTRHEVKKSLTWSSKKNRPTKTDDWSKPHF